MNDRTIHAQLPIHTLFRSMFIGAAMTALGVNAGVVEVSSLEIKLWMYAMMVLPTVYGLLGGFGALLNEFGAISETEYEHLRLTGARLAMWHDRLVTGFAWLVLSVTVPLWLIWVWTYPR
jgi:hypothetical protein